MISILVTIPAGRAHQRLENLITAVRHAVEHLGVQATVAELPQGYVLPVGAIGPQQLNVIDDTHVTVTYPAGSTTVMSVQPGGEIETRPGDARGPYETALRCPDRLVFAPLGPNGAVFVFPFVDTIPNA